MSHPLAKSAIVSPLAAGAGHIAGGTTANLFAGQSPDNAFANSFKGIEKSMAIGGAIGVVTTAGIMYASGKNPLTRNPLASKTGTTAFRSFTSSNFRQNLGKLTGDIPENSHAHHVFPQKFASQFSKAGININDPRYGVWWNSSSHLQNAAGYNAAWSNYLSTNPSQTQILNYGRQLMGQYGIPVFF
jgi:hypothetical protein